MNREDRPIPKMAEVSLPRWRSGSRPIRQSLERSGNFDRADQNNPIGSESKDTDPGAKRRCPKVGLLRVRCKTTLARLRTRPGGASPLRCEAPSEFAELRCTRWWQTSLTCRATRSQADSLPSIARLNNARSRLRPSARNRPQFIRTSYGLNAPFCPTLRPLFHAISELTMGISLSATPILPVVDLPKLIHKIIMLPPGTRSLG